MQSAIWIILGGVSGAVCGLGALRWTRCLLQSRGREETLSLSTQRILVIAALVCGGIIGFCTGQWLPMVSALAVLTIGITAAAADWLCRIIPNPTVLALFALKLVLVAASLLRIPGAPPFGLLAALGGMVFCFLLFSLPGLFGKRVGAGDIKLAAAIGFLLEFQNALVAVVLMGMFVLGYCMLQQKMPLLMFLKTNIPMGPFIMAGALAACMAPYFIQ